MALKGTSQNELNGMRARVADNLLAEAADKRSVELVNQAADALERAGLRNLASVVRAYPDDRGWVARPNPDIWEEVVPWAPEEEAEPLPWADDEPDPRLDTSARLRAKYDANPSLNPEYMAEQVEAARKERRRPGPLDQIMRYAVAPEEE